jgi:hypothetical protein
MSTPTFNTREFSYNVADRTFVASASDLKLSPIALPTHINLVSQRTGAKVKFMRMYSELSSDGELLQALYGNGATDTSAIIKK